MISVEKIKEPGEHIKYFDIENFYVGTKRPLSLNSAQRLKIISNGYQIKYNNKVIGLIYDISSKANKYIFLSMSFLNYEYCTSFLNENDVDTIFDFFKNHKKYAKVYLYIEGYDDNMLDFSHRFQLIQKGKLNQNTFKANRYYDSYIYEK